MYSKKWSDQLIELSRLHLVNGVHVKSLNGGFGILNVNSERTVYQVALLDKSNETFLIFNSVNEMIEAGWAVD
jgi:hypothetical protein